MADKKARQVCAAVEHTLATLLGGEIEDERLTQLIILAVEPTQRGGRIRVLCGAQQSVQKALAALDGAKRYIRQEVAHALQKKHAPDLEFIVVPFGDPGGGP